MMTPTTPHRIREVWINVHFTPDGLCCVECGGPLDRVKADDGARTCRCGAALWFVS